MERVRFQDAVAADDHDIAHIVQDTLSSDDDRDEVLQLKDTEATGFQDLLQAVRGFNRRLIQTTDC
jgi:hypothetical protein